MTIKIKAVVIGWDKVPGTTKYEILRDGVVVSSTRAALETKIGVQDHKDHDWSIRAQPSGVVQELKADWA